MSVSFFSDIIGFTGFEDAVEPNYYQPAPQDWLVVVTDVQGSTKTIEAGRYKDVNMVGAACITAAVNACEGVSIPYVFGGDGATILIPPEHIEKVQEELLAVKKISRVMHDMQLRVGVVPISEITKRNKRFLVAKYVMPTGAVLAMFRGGGAKLADDLVKNQGFELEAIDESIDPNLEGLSCRWHPITSRRDTMLTLLVQALDPDQEANIYSELNRFITETLGNDFNPMHQENVSYKWPTKETMRQALIVWKQGNILKNFLEHVFVIIFFNISNRLNLVAGDFNVPEYRKDMITNSDYQKFDDMLRMVVDCTNEQAEKIESYLAQKHAEGHIVYGTHYSDTALMTCFVTNLESDGHVHFVDGNDGGYAMAASQLKQQEANQSQNNQIAV